MMSPGKPSSYISPKYYFLLKFIKIPLIMTIEAFNKTAFGADMEMTYNNEVYEIVAVEFEEKLLAYKLEENSKQYSWARCENCTINLFLEEHYLLFKKETIKNLREKIQNKEDEIREQVFISIMKGFENQNSHIIHLYLDDEFIQICKEELNMDLHSFVQKILRDSIDADVV